MQGVKSLALLVDATDDEIEWLVNHSSEVRLDTGDYFFREGEPSRQFCIVLDGEMQISRLVDGQEVILGTTPRGVMSGEYHLLAGTTAIVTARAIMPTRLMVFELPDFLGIFGKCQSLALQIVTTAAQRMHMAAQIDTQRDKMAALGKLSAGLAHELNNPAAAARRSARTLREILPSFQVQTLRLGRLGISDEHLEGLIAFMNDVRARKADRPPLPAIHKADLEDEVCDWLGDQGVEEYWDLGSSFVDWHVTIDELKVVLSWVPAADRDALLAWMCDSLTTVDLLEEIEQSTVRISDLIGAVKSYTYMDRGAYQEVDIHRDLDNTLMILKNRLSNITVERDYAADLPHLIARGGALNQVWTNLIDNAIDAMQGNGTLRLITRCENDYIMVEVADNGLGISDDAREHLFEPFFTTKDIGSGTGLGLVTSHRIIQDHKGSIEFWSEPGNTRFIVRLPIRRVEDIDDENIGEQQREQSEELV